MPRALAAGLCSALLAGPAAASLTGEPAESRWNLLGILTRGSGRAASASGEQLAEADAARGRGEHGRAVFLYRLFLERCPENAPCAVHLDRARSGLGRALAAVAPPEDEDSPAPKEAARWLESVEDAELRAQGEPDRLRMRALLAKKGLRAALEDAARGDWADAAARVEDYAAAYADTSADEGARAYLARLRDAGRAGGAVPAEGRAMADRAESLLGAPPPPAPARTRAGAALALRPEGLPSFQDAVSGASASGGAAFDGASRDRAPLSVSLSLRDGKPNELSVSAGDWNVAVGRLGVGDRSPLLDESPYVNLRRVTRSPLEAAVDRRVELQAGVVDIHSRFFGDDASSAPLGRLGDMARRLGLPETLIAPLSSRFAVDDPVRSELGVLAGVLAQFGRATSLPLPAGSPVAADLAWSATALLKASGYVPNAAANASAGVRVTLPSGHQGALIGGWTEEALPVGHDLLSSLARGTGAALDLHREGSPQATAVVSGPVPGTVVDLELGASQRWAQTVVERKLQAGLSFDVAGKPVTARVSYKDERGKSIEYGRGGVAVEASLTFAPGSSVYALCEKERVSYGGVEVSNDGCLTGVRWTPGAAVTVNADMVFGGRDSVSEAGTAEAAALAAGIGRLGAAGLEAADRISAKLDPWEGLSAAMDVVAGLPASEVEAALDAIAASSLPPQAKELMAGLLSRAAAGVPSASAAEIRRLIEKEFGSVPDLRKEYAGRRTLAVEAVGLLSDPGFWDGAARQLVRSQMLAAVSELKLSMGPLGTLRVTPASTLLMAAAARYNGSPLSPMTREDADILFRRTALAGLGRAAGAPDGAGTSAVVDALIDRSRDAFASALETTVIPRLSGPGERAALAEQALSYLPPDVAARLRASLGPDLGLSRLDAAGAQKALRALPELAARELRAHAGPAAAEALDQALALAAQSVRREINRAVLQLMLAAEEFDRLTVDRGLKPGDLGARMIAESFKRLDERKRRALRAHRAGSIERLRTELDENERREERRP